MRRFRSRSEERRYRSTEVDWGVALKEGHSDEDDPRAHEGVVQHAYLATDDRRAICGYSPPQQAMPDGTKRPALALPSDRYNPSCRKCKELIWSQTEETNLLTQQIGVAEATATLGSAEQPGSAEPSPAEQPGPAKGPETGKAAGRRPRQ